MRRGAHASCIGSSLMVRGENRLFEASRRVGRPVRSWVGLWLGTAVVASALVASSAFAEPPPRVRDLFARGRDLRTRGDCAQAVPFFRQAFDEYPAGLGSLRNTAECEETLGHLASARRAWLELQRALRVNHDPKYADWSPDAEQGAARLASRVGVLTVDVDAVTDAGEFAAASEAEVTVNGVRLTQDQFSVEVERDPGHYVVRAGSRGRNQEERAVDLAAGDSKRVAMRVVVETALSARSRFSSPPGGAGAEARGTPARTRHAELVAAWIATGIGAASLVGAGVAWLVQQGALDDLTRECPQPSMCSRSQMAAVQATRDEGVSATTASRVLGVVGLVGVATGVVLFATRSSSSDGAALVISPTGVSAVGRF